MLEIVRPLLGFGTHLWAGRTGLFFRFVIAATVFTLVSAALRRLSPAARTRGQVLASIALIAVLATPAIAALVVAHSLALYGLVEHARLGRATLPAAAILLALQVIGPTIWLTAFPGYEGRVREFVAFASNMTMLRAWSYAYDRRAGRLADRPPLMDYAHYTFFFPGFVNGPLLSLDEFRRGRLAAYWADDGGRGGLDWTALRRVATGFVALACLLPLGAALGAEEYTAVAGAGALAAWRHAIVIYLGVYLGFSAWSEVTIGYARLCGVTLPENFDAPHRSYGIADFWRRWNIRLGWWMRFYVYLPLGGGHPRNPRWLVWRNVAAVFAATAVYHQIGGAKLLGPGVLALPAFYAGWTLWALYNTVGTIATRTVQTPTAWRLRDLVIVVLTLLFHCVALLTAFFPATLPLAQLGAIYRHLAFLP